MAGLQIDNAAVATARQAGYSDAEIVSHLAEKSPEQFKAAESAGYSPKEILAHLSGAPDAPSGVAAGAVEGVKGLATGAAKTLKTYAGLDTGLDTKGDPNYVPATVVPKDGHWYDPRTYNWSQVPQAVAEAAPGMTQDIVAARTGQRVAGPMAGLLAGAGSYLLRTRGDAAKKDAEIRTGDTNAEPTTADKARALLTGAVEAVPTAVGLGRFLPGVAAKAAGGVTGALSKGLTTAGTEAAASGVRDLVGQAGATVGTPGGLKIDPNQAAGNAVVGGVMGGGMASPRVAADIATARAFRKITPDLGDASSSFANRVQAAAGDRNLGNISVGADAYNRAHADVKSELSDATAEARKSGALTQDASNVLDAIKSGSKPTVKDYATLEASLKDHPGADGLMSLARQAHVASLVGETGKNSNGEFYGGVGTKIAGLMGLNSHGVAKALVANFAMEHLGSHIIAHAPAAIGVGGAAYGVGRAIDKLTGARSPAQRFVNNFADPNAAVRAPAPPAPAGFPPQAGPWGPMGGGPTGPQVPQAPAKPIGIPPGFAQILQSHVRQTNRDDRNADRQRILVAQQLLSRLAAQNQPPAPAPQAPPGIDPNNLPREITAPAKNIMGGAANSAKMAAAAALSRQRILGTSQAEDLARSSPMVQDAGGFNAMSNPDMGKRASEIIKNVKAFQTLTAQPPAEEGEISPQPNKSAPEISPQPDPLKASRDLLKALSAREKIKTNSLKAAAGPVTKVTKANGKVTSETAPPQAEAPVEEVPFSEGLKHTKPSAEDRAVADKATAEFKQSSGAPDFVAARYHASTMDRQSRIRDRLLEMSGHADFPAEDIPLMEALSNVTKVRRRDELAALVSELASKHPGPAGEVIRKHLGPEWAAKIWKKK